ncbi:MAG TPA: CARDB domain-containing protein [Tepidisphaeraceae bacterium]|nr:CARDB domain-containing protein [Tepidisphaeraceae bacterium]
MTSHRHNRSRRTPQFEALEGRRLLAADLVSVVDNSTTPGNAASLEPSISADGRFVAFSSSANNLVAGDANNASDVFVHDRTNNRTILVSVNTAGAPGNGASSEPSISADGRFVSFTSKATDLIAGDTNLHDDIFIRDLQSNTTFRVSADTAGGNSGDFSAEPFTSADGGFVAFTSRATDLTTPDNGVDSPAIEVTDVFLRDLGNPNNENDDVTRMVSVSAVPGPAGELFSGNGRSFDPSVSGDGRWVAFRSEATDLAPGVTDNNTFRDIYVRDMQTGVTRLISVGPNGVLANGASDSPAVSEDGTYVVFSSEASNLVANDTNGAVRDVFLHNLVTGVTTLVSANQQRTGSANGPSSEPSISTDGQFIAFTSGASDLVTLDGNNATDIFLYDIDTGALNLVSTNVAGTAAGNGASADAFVAPGGQFVAFSSTATDLVSGDSNGVADAFVVTAPDRTVDTAAPTAALATVQPSNNTGGQFLQFAVTYSDNSDLAITSFGNDDVTITPPGGSPTAATFVGSTGSGSNATAVYQIAAPGGTLDEADEGLYTVTVLSGGGTSGVADAAGNKVAAGALTPQLQVEVAPADGPDLTASIPDPVPAAVGGSRGRLRAVVTNSGNQVANGRIVTNLYLSTDPLLDGGDTQLATRPMRFRANPNISRRVNFRFLYPTVPSAGTYYLLVVPDAANAIAESRESNNAASAPVVVAPPFVDLRAQLAAVPATLVSGRRARVPFTLFNDGNVPAVGQVTYRLLASTDQTLGSGDVEVATVTRRLALRNGRSRVTPLSFLTPTIAGGTYWLIVDVDYTGTVPETNDANNSDPSDAQVTIS